MTLGLPLTPALIAGPYPSGSTVQTAVVIDGPVRARMRWVTTLVPTAQRGTASRVAGVEAVSEDFLLALATIAATLIGLLMLGGFFYLETGISRVASFEGHALPFLRTTIKFTVTLYVFALGSSLGLAVLDPTWMRVLFAALAVLVVGALVDWNLRYVALARVVHLPRSAPARPVLHEPGPWTLLGLHTGPVRSRSVIVAARARPHPPLQGVGR